MSFGQYVKHGWVLTPIPPGRKSPVLEGWQHRAAGIDDPAVADELPGAGLLHAYSQTCCIDIDDFEQAAEWCELRGIDLHALWNAPDAVRITSGRANRGKLLYRLVLPLVSHQVSLKLPGLLKPKAVIDFRCGTRGELTKQDVLPPTIHPDTGKPYQWEFDPLLSHWSDPPVLPEQVRAVWAELIAPRPGERGTAPAPAGAEADEVRAVLATKDPDCDRNAWVKIIAAVHHGSGGADWGLALVDEWSSKGAKYEGFGKVDSVWRSLRTDHPDPVTMAGLGPPVATEAEFAPVETLAPPTPEQRAAAAAAEADVQHAEDAKTRKGAEDLLVANLIYVRKADAYYDINLHEFLANDHAIQHTWSCRMPKVETMGGGTVALNPVEILKQSKKRRVVYAPAFHPGREQFFEHEGKEYVNEFCGGLPDPLEPTARERETILSIFNRLQDDVVRNWLLQFYAHAVQKPGVKIRAMPIIWSHHQGNGKGTMLQTIPTLMFTQRYSTSISNSMLAEGYNGYLVGKWFGHFTEMHAATKGDKSIIMNKIKPWISDDELPINIKFGAAYPTVNFMFFTGASNHEDVVEISQFDRRFAIGSMNTVPIMTSEERKRFYNDFLLTPRAAGVLRHFFLHYPIGSFDKDNAPPASQAKVDMARQSMSHEMQVILEAVESNDEPFASDVVSASQIMSFLKTAAPRSYMSPAKLGLMLEQPPLHFVKRRPNTEENGKRGKVTLYACRNQDYWKSVDDRQVLQYWQNQADPLTL